MFLLIFVFFYFPKKKLDFIQKILISGKISLFQVKFPYFRQNFLISGKVSLFQAKFPYFRQKYLKFNPRVEFKAVVFNLA